MLMVPWGVCVCVCVCARSDTEVPTTPAMPLQNTNMFPSMMWQDAVLLALSFDMSLASATANRPEDEPALKRSLWLTIARHIVQQHPSQDQVNPIPPHSTFSDAECHMT